MRLSPTLSSLLLISSVAAQAPLINSRTRGMLPAISMGVVFDHDRNTICRKEPGLPAKLDTFVGVYGPNLPEFTMAESENWVSNQVLPPGGQPLPGPLEVDAFTTINDFLPVVHNSNYDGAGTEAFQIQQGNGDDWAAFFFAIETPQLSNGQNVYGYYFENPGFPYQLRNAVYHEIVGGEFVAGSVPAPPVTASIAAMDSAMGMMADSGGAFEWNVVEVRNRLCFSLTPASALALWNTQIPSLVGGEPQFTGATIFRAEYDAAGAVVELKVEKNHLQLGLSPNDDIDALAIAKSTPPANSGPPITGLTGRQYVFSLDASNGYGGEQLLVHGTLNGQTAGTTLPLRTEGGDPLVGPAGTLDGDVKGACAKDPEVQSLSALRGTPEKREETATVMSLSLQAQDSLVQATDSAGPQDMDYFELNGVLSGWGASQPHDAAVFVAVYHLGGVELRQLPDRTSQQDTYEFSETFSVPWHVLPSANLYRVVVGTLGTSPGHQNLWLESFGSWLARKQ